MRNRFLFFFFVCIAITVNGQEFNAFDTDGKRHGKWQKKYNNSDQLRYQGVFDHGKEVGEFKFYKPSSGKTPTAIKVFSQETDTVSVRYFTNKGKVISKGNMIAKDRVGVWTYYHKGSSKVMMTEVYTSGKLNGEQRTYFENGQLTEKTIYTDGKKQGKRTVYSDKGVLIKQFTYENDQLHGITTYYDMQGRVKIEGSYKRDRKDGVWSYYEKGKLVEQKQFPLVKSKR